MLNMFEPRIFPTAMSASCLKAATAQVASSGSEVPMDTSVRPITSSEIPIASASATADPRMAKAPNTRPRTPPTVRAECLKIIREDRSPVSSCCSTCGASGPSFLDLQTT